MQNSKTVAQTILGETAHFGFCPPRIGFFRGVGGVPKICFSLESSYFRSPCKILKFYETPFYGFEQTAERGGGGGERNKPICYSDQLEIFVITECILQHLAKPGLGSALARLN